MIKMNGMQMKISILLLQVCIQKIQTHTSIFHLNYAIRFTLKKKIPTTVAYHCSANCSDKIKNDVMFKEALIEYKAYLIKSGYDEENVDKKLINFAVGYKRKGILENKIKKKRKSPMKKYCFVTKYGPTFPDIKTGFKNLSTSLKMIRN